MCEFCKNIARTNKKYSETKIKGGDFIFQSDGKFGNLIDTGDSGCLDVLNDIRFCPKCGTKLN